MKPQPTSKCCGLPLQRPFVKLYRCPCGKILNKDGTNPKLKHKPLTSDDEPSHMVSNPFKVKEEALDWKQRFDKKFLKKDIFDSSGTLYKEAILKAAKMANEDQRKLMEKYEALKSLVIQAVARGYCSKKNEHKELDSDLLIAIVDEVLPIIGQEIQKAKKAYGERNMRSNKRYTLSEIIEALGLSDCCVRTKLSRGKSLAESLRPSWYCKNCEGKGYSTERTSETAYADFEGDKTTTKQLFNYNPCSCDRGKQIKEMLEKAEKRGEAKKENELRQMLSGTGGFGGNINTDAGNCGRGIIKLT